MTDVDQNPASREIELQNSGLEGNINLDDNPAEGQIVGNVADAEPYEEGMSTLDEPVSETIVSHQSLIL